MDTTALIIGLIGGGTIGALGTAFLNINHERTARRRERAIEASVQFLAARDAAVDALLRVRDAAVEAQAANRSAREAVGDFLSRSKDLVEAAKTLPAAKGGSRAAESPSSPSDDALARAIRAIYEVHDAALATEVTRGRLGSLDTAVREIDGALPLLERLEPPFAGFGKRLRDVLARIKLSLRSSKDLEDATEQSARATNAAAAHVPMLKIALARRSREAVAAAVAAAEALRAVTEIGLKRALSGVSRFEDDEFAEAVERESSAADSFAEAVSRVA